MAVSFAARPTAAAQAPGAQPSRPLRIAREPWRPRGRPAPPRPPPPEALGAALAAARVPPARGGYSAASAPLASSGCEEGAGDDYAEPPLQLREYRVYVESILRPLHPDALRAEKRARGPTTTGRALLEEALMLFVGQLRGFVTGCDDRKLSKAALRRARGIESQLAAASEQTLPELLRASVLAPDDLHGIWHGFSIVRGWRDVRVPQECLLYMLHGALSALGDAARERWTTQALTWELTLPEVHQAISVSAWPPLCELLGRLPDCVTPAELQEALWQQSFVENPTHAPDHRNFRRFATLAAQMVAIGVELDTDKVERLVQQTLELDRPWRERRDVMSGVLSAASVEDRRKVVRNLDRRFEEHADIDDFEIVCGIAEAVGIEIPREGAIRRVALRRWALDAKRGGALPIAQLIDFVDCDAAIGEDVALSLRQKGRVADAALLLSRLPRDVTLRSDADTRGEPLDVGSGDAELARLREVLAMDDDQLEGHGVFGPVEEGSFCVPFDRPSDAVGFAQTAEDAREAVERLRGAPLLAVAFKKEEAPFWHSPLTLFSICTDVRIELFDLVALRNDDSGAWPEAANCLRALLSDPCSLKIVYGEDLLQIFAYTLSLGIASTLKRGDREPLGPTLDLKGVMTASMCGANEPWSRVAARYLGVRFCGEESGANWSRRPLRESMLHHAAAEAWCSLPVVRALCAHGLVSQSLLRRHLCIQERPRIYGIRVKLGKGHTLGQLAPPGRLTEAGESPNEAADASEGPPLPRATRMAVLAEAVFASTAADGEELPELPPGTLVEVFDERFGGLASVAARPPARPSLPSRPIGSSAEAPAPLETPPERLRRVPAALLRAANGWELCPAWVAALPRANTGAAEEDEAKAPPPPPPEIGGAAAATGAPGAQMAADVEREAMAEELINGLYDMALAESLLQSVYDTQE